MVDINTMVKKKKALNVNTLNNPIKMQRLSEQNKIISTYMLSTGHFSLKNKARVKVKDWEKNISYKQQPQER